MSQYFPADVSLRVVGDDLDGAQRLFPVAKQLLFRALRVQESGNKTNVSMFIPGSDGSLVNVYLAGALKHVYVQPGKRARTPGGSEELKTETSFPAVYVSKMLSGVVRSPDESLYTGARVLENIIDLESVMQLREFHPDSITSSVYQLDMAWQNVEQLAINESGLVAPGVAVSAFPKPSAFSGAMKRLVQALLGIGRTQTDTPEYLTGVLPESEPDLVVYPNFDWKWIRTHGLTQGIDGAYWMVEINKDTGIFAMPLPFFFGTDFPEFVEWLREIGDLDTAYVVEVLGGLPTGEHFPEGTDLDDAVASGHVIKLADADLLAPFYADPDTSIDKRPFFPDCGWAFSEGGTKVVNTTFWYRNEAAVFALATEFAPVPPMPTNPDDRFMLGELWQINITLSPINWSPTAENPAGSGAATIQMLRRDEISSNPDYNCWWKQDFGLTYVQIRDCLCRAPSEGSRDEKMQQFMSFRSKLDDDNDSLILPGAPLFAFFNGEQMEVVERVGGRSAVPGVEVFDFATSTYGHHRGTSLDYSLEFPTTIVDGGLFLQSAHLFVPHGCREGYVLVVPRKDGSDFVAHGKGYFSDLGLVTLGTKTYPTSDWLLSFSNFYNGDVPRVSENSGVFDSFFIFRSGATINCGPSPWYSMSSPFNVGDDDISRALDTYQHADSQGELELAANAAAKHITFVGAP